MSAAARASERYCVFDDDVAAGSTLGSPKMCLVVKSTGAIEKIYGIDAGAEMLGSFVVAYWDECGGGRLAARRGVFAFHPERQEHAFSLCEGLGVREEVFVLNRRFCGEEADPALAYYIVELRNESPEERRVGAYAFSELERAVDAGVTAAYEPDLRAIVAWNTDRPERALGIACSHDLAGFETSNDDAKAVDDRIPGRLAMRVDVPKPRLGIQHLSLTLAPGESRRFFFTLTVGVRGREGVRETLRHAPHADAALRETQAHYREMLERSVLLTPSVEINRGVLWAKANMVRVMSDAPTGWGFTNSPTRSNSCVARDTAWFTMGSDYLSQRFSREIVLQFLKRQEPNGLIPEYYDMLDGKTEDYGLNINDNTPLIVLAVWHAYLMSGDEAFLERAYAPALKAVEYIASQRNEQGLVWCDSTKTGSRGMVGWRNIIPGYRLSGAVTELNSECYAAFRVAAKMARKRGRENEAERFDRFADDLREAIDRHLLNPRNGLYYLAIDVDGTPRSEVTADLVFPVMFGVASHETTARIARRLSQDDFWTASGMRTVPRGAPNYSPDRASGLLGGVWAGVTFWYALCISPFSSEFMDEALRITFENYARDPRRGNTVPGQFSEWLDGETLVNRGMMLSPWFPPRYLWAALEGAAGFSPEGDRPRIEPRLAPDWRWIGVRRLPYRGSELSWFAVRAEGLRLFVTRPCAEIEGIEQTVLPHDVSDRIEVNEENIVVVALRDDKRTAIMLGSTDSHAASCMVSLPNFFPNGARVRMYDALLAHWNEERHCSESELECGLLVPLERKGFALLEVTE